MTSPSESDIRAAMRESLKFAKKEHYLDVADVADRMGLPNAWVLFKWAETGRIPALVIPAFEKACGTALLSRSLAEASGHLVIRARSHPIGSAADWSQVNLLVAQAMAEAAAVVAAPAPERRRATIKAINKAMDILAYMRFELAQEAGQ